MRERAINETHTHEAKRFYIDERPVSEFFGQNVLDIDKMSKYMSENAWKAVLAAVKEGARLDRGAADEIEDIHERAKVYSIDVKEMIIDDVMWPLPKYRELLFF